MAGSIAEFKASFNKELARPNKFDVDIPIPIGMIPYLGTSRQLKFRCETAELPSRTYATAEQKFGSNPVEKFPYQVQFNDLNLTFIVDDDMSQKVFFDAWLNYINPQYNNNFRYKNDYATILTVNQYNVANELSYSVNLYDAYPISMNQLDLNWSDDGFHKISVDFAYTYWQNNSLQAIGMQLVDAGINAISSALAGPGVSESNAQITAESKLGDVN